MDPALLAELRILTGQAYFRLGKLDAAEAEFAKVNDIQGLYPELRPLAADWQDRARWKMKRTAEAD